MFNKIVCNLSVQNANIIYKFLKIGFKFHNGQPNPFIEI
jgi:hypothetical protein